MKHLKTFLFIEGNTVANETVLYAAQMNAGIKEPGINLLFAFAMTLKTVGREDNTSVEMIGGNTLHIDAKINGALETVLCVEEVLIFETVNQLEESN